MTGPHPATAAVRVAVRETLAECAPGDVVLVACSGGADSLALAAALAFEARRPGLSAGAVVVDHRLQADSAGTAATVSQRLSQIGLDPVEVVTADVAASSDGLEAAARSARYAALDAAAVRHGARLVLLGHTLDDQAEQVLLGLTRGAGARSLAGMPRARDRFRRPLLGVTREQTRASCTAEGLSWWDDPMNEDTTFTRVRARRALVDLERDLGPGVATALARSADQLREDADHLDALADSAVASLLRPVRGGTDPGSGRVHLEPVGLSVEVDVMLALPRPVRTRAWRRLVIAAGAPPGQVSTRHTEACDALLTQLARAGPGEPPGTAVRRPRGRPGIHRPTRSG